MTTTRSITKQQELDEFVRKNTYYYVLHMDEDGVWLDLPEEEDYGAQTFKTYEEGYAYYEKLKGKWLEENIHDGQLAFVRMCQSKDRYIGETCLNNFGKREKVNPKRFEDDWNLAKVRRKFWGKEDWRNYSLFHY